MEQSVVSRSDELPATPDQDSFALTLRTHTVASLWVLAALVVTVNPLILLLDRLLLPEALHLVFFVRLLIEVAGGTALVLLFRRREWTEERAGAIAPAMVALLYSATAMLAWIDGSFASPYAASLPVILILSGSLFLWPARQAGSLYGAGYLFFILPLVLGLVPVGTLGPALAHQGFLVAVSVIVVASHEHRYRLVSKEYYSSLALKRTRGSLEEAFARLRDLDRVKNQFFSNISHELKTPLTMILAPLETLLAGDLGPLEPGQAGHLQTIRRNALGLLRLINDLLDLARLEERHVELKREAMDVPALLEEIVEYARPLAEKKGVRLALEASGATEGFSADGHKLERVFVNLLANALKFTPAGGQVTLALETDENELRIRVSDTGIGIASDQHARIFERFTQADGSATRKYGGTGIGLAYAREIVELHAGRISLESTVGAGSTFIVHLPRPAAQTAVPAIEGGGEPAEWGQSLVLLEESRFFDLEEAMQDELADPVDDRAKPFRILVVEDEPQMLRFLVMLLGEEHTVHAARNGREALEKAQGLVPDLVVTDFMMPEMDGLMLIAGLRNDHALAEIPVIMLTVRAQLEDRLEARERGADVYLAKPFSSRELTTAVRKMLEKRGRQARSVMRTQVQTLETISAGLAHEMQNPLSYIKNAVYLIGESVEKLMREVKGRERFLKEIKGNDELDRLEKKIRRLYTTAERGLTRIEQMVKLLRTYSREGYPDTPVELPVDEAVQTVASLISPRQEHEVALHLELDAEEMAVRCIPEEMHQAIRNLIQNALDATGPGGWVKVKTRVDAGTAVLQVQDNGSGIPREILGRIFTPFFTTKEPGQGMGLGLSITHQVITRAGGQIEVQSSPGAGTLFTVNLPGVRARRLPVAAAAGTG